MQDSLPENVVRTSELAWESWPGVKPPFGGTIKAVGVTKLRHIGVHLDRIEPGQRSCPLHDHLFEEEQFYLESGLLTVTERRPDGERREFELRAGELIVYRAGTRLAHSFSNLGSESGIVLAFSGRHPGDLCTYPDSDKTNFRGFGIGAWSGRSLDATDTGSVIRAEQRLAHAAERRRLEKPVWCDTEARPDHVVPAMALSEIGHGSERCFGAALSRAGGAEQVFLHQHRLPPGCSPRALHRHRFDEELVLVRDGELELRQVDLEGSESQTRLVTGDWAAWRPRELAHQIRNVSDRDAHYLVLGTGLAWDLIEFPERGELLSRALDQIGRLEPLEYFAGESEG